MDGVIIDACVVRQGGDFGLQGAWKRMLMLLQSGDKATLKGHYCLDHLARGEIRRARQ